MTNLLRPKVLALKHRLIESFRKSRIKLLSRTSLAIGFLAIIFLLFQKVLLSFRSAGPSGDLLNSGLLAIMLLTFFFHSSFKQPSILLFNLFPVGRFESHSLPSGLPGSVLLRPAGGNDRLQFLDSTIFFRANFGSLWIGLWSLSRLLFGSTSCFYSFSNHSICHRYLAYHDPGQPPTCSADEKFIRPLTYLFRHWPLLSIAISAAGACSQPFFPLRFGAIYTGLVEYLFPAFSPQFLGFGVINAVS